VNIADHIRTIPDFPKPGIEFYDISTLLAHPQAWAWAIEELARVTADWRPDVIAGIESRGFLLSAPLSLKLGIGFVMIRKQGKLPGEVVSYTYDLEYGTDTVELQHDAVKPGQRVLIVDDLIATGGTLAAACALMRKIGAEVAGIACLVELGFLDGRDRLDVPIAALARYD
jgi:adenine phosphoribosyltransferase